MRRGATISGLLHLVFLLAIIFSGDWFASDDEPFELTEIQMVDGTEFDALLSTAPIVPNEGPADLSEPSQGQGAPSPVDTPVDQTNAAVAPELVAATPPPEQRPDLPDLSLPPPPRSIPTEAPAPSIAEIPSPDVLPDQAPEPQSPPSTEPVQPLASRTPEVPQPLPTRPPEPEPEPVAEPEPEPEPEEAEPTELVEASPDAPESLDPREARLPVAKPADKAAAARAAAEARRLAEAEREPEPDPAPTEQATAPEPQPQQNTQQRPAGGSQSVFAARMTRGEKDALRLGIKKHFVYNGARPRGLAVIIEIRLDKSGKITGKPKLLNASGGDASAQQALFRAGSTALRKAQAFGEFDKLPADKYDSWDLIHVRFTPDQDIGFPS